MLVLLCILGIVVFVVVYSILNRLFRWNRKKNLEFLLLEMLPLLEKYGIEYWLDFGTLLGAWRNGSVIPYDYDVDVSIHSSQMEKLERLIGELSLPLYVKGFKKDIWYKIRSKRRLCSFDFYVYHDLDDGFLCQSFACVPEDGKMKYEPYKCYGKIKRDLIFPLCKGRMTAGGAEHSVSLPARTEEYLNVLYANPENATHRGFLNERFFIKKTVTAKKWTFE